MFHRRVFRGAASSPSEKGSELEKLPGNPSLPLFLLKDA